MSRARGPAGRVLVAEDCEAHLFAQALVIQSSVPFKGDPIDNRVFDDCDNQRIALKANLDVGKKTRSEKCL